MAMCFRPSLESLNERIVPDASALPPVDPTEPSISVPPSNLGPLLPPGNPFLPGTDQYKLYQYFQLVDLAEEKKAEALRLTDEISALDQQIAAIEVQIQQAVAAGAPAHVIINLGQTRQSLLTESANKQLARQNAIAEYQLALTAALQLYQELITKQHIAPFLPFNPPEVYEFPEI